MFTLKGSKPKYELPKVATKEEIDRQKMIGKTHIVYNDASYFIYEDDDYDRENFQKKVGLEDYVWYKETTGSKNWVLYNPLQYKLEHCLSGKKVLKFDAKHYSHGKIELPINASSCCGMFSWCTLPDNFKFENLFNTKRIIDMNLMFAGCVMPKNMEFGAFFKTHAVVDMRYMFYQCCMPSSFVLDERFDTSNVVRMDYMFSECIFPKRFKLPKSFDTSKVKNMDHMFYKSEFRRAFYFGDNFYIPPDTKIDSMFENASIDEEMIDDKYKEDFKYMYTRLEKN